MQAFLATFVAPFVSTFLPALLDQFLSDAHNLLLQQYAVDHLADVRGEFARIAGGARYDMYSISISKLRSPTNSLPRLHGRAASLRATSPGCMGEQRVFERPAPALDKEVDRCKQFPNPRSCILQRPQTRGEHRRGKRHRLGAWEFVGLHLGIEYRTYTPTSDCIRLGDNCAKPFRYSILPICPTNSRRGEVQRLHAKARAVAAKARRQIVVEERGEVGMGTAGATMIDDGRDHRR